MSGIKNEIDDFWDVSKLVPKKKPSLVSFATSRQVSDHLIEGDCLTDDDKRKITVSRLTDKSDSDSRSYIPESNNLIKRVTIRKSLDKFDFYGNFRKAALLYYDYKTPKCEFVPYYSYLPQYTQLTSAQKEYYFYWRSELRRDKYIKCDYSYLYLYVYEILNLPDKYLPEVAIKSLCKLWKEYRKSLPRIDSYFSVWIRDYCLVHALSCPMDEIRDFIFEVIQGVDFKEFYLSDVAKGGSDATDAMLAYLSDYDWRSTRYASGENSEIFKKHLIGAMSRVVNSFCSVSSRLSSNETETVRTDAFPHSLCTHMVKCKLEIEYVPISKDDGLRNLITSSVRYTENKLRALLGVKSRLGIKSIDDTAKRLIDSYFDNIFEVERLRRQKANAPEYEKLYEAESSNLSFLDADKIEMASWGTTARLVAESDDALEFNESQHDAVPRGSITEYPETQPKLNHTNDLNNKISAAEGSENYFSSIGLSEQEIELLIELIANGTPITSDEAYEQINEAFCDSNIGDVILEPSDNGYILIEDYREDLEKFF